MDEYPEWEEEYEPPEPERPRDPAIDRAKDAIVQLLNERNKEVFYGRQVEVILEGQFFHWIADFALQELVEEKQIGAERVELEKGSAVRVRFVFNRRHRYRRRQIKSALEVLRDLSRIAGACGAYAELLFKLAFMKRGFRIVAEDARRYGKRVWRRSRHNLDFIVVKRGRAYGVEVKNRLDYIERGELEIKLEMWRYLGVKPVFVMREAAKSYNYEIIQRGGFALIFGAQIYPPGQEELVQRIRRALGFPVVCSKGIPERMLDRFELWHKGKLGRGKKR